MTTQDTEYTFPKFNNPASCCAGYEGQMKVPENKTRRAKPLATIRNVLSLAKK